MNNEPITIKKWIEKHSFDAEKSFFFLKGKTLDGIVVMSLNTKVSEIALDSYINDIRAVQKKNSPNKEIRLSSLDVMNYRRKYRRTLGSKSLNQTKPITLSYQSEKQSSESSSMKCKFIAAAEQSKIDSDGYILINEFAQTLKKLDVNWDKFSNFKNFLEFHESIIEFKPDTPYYALAIRVKNESAKTKLEKQENSQLEIQTIENSCIEDKSKQKKPVSFTANVSKDVDPAILERIQKSQREKALREQSKTLSIKTNHIKNKSITEKSEQVNSLEQILKEADKIYMDTCVLMETPVEEFFEKANPILRTKKKEILHTAIP
jgi:translation initiation factor IF-2